MSLTNLVETNESEARFIHDESSKAIYRIIQRGLVVDGTNVPSMYLVTSDSGLYEAIDRTMLNPSKRFYRPRNVDDVIQEFINAESDNEKLLITLSCEICDFINIDAGSRDNNCFVDASTSNIEIAKDDIDTFVYKGDTLSIIDGDSYDFDSYLIISNDRIIFV
nr:hypothetical protein [Vibrio splendidus]MCC4878474.1 hypothetical protein [Vibrio splendidus]